MAKVGKRPVLWPIFAHNQSAKKPCKFASSPVKANINPTGLGDERKSPAKVIDQLVNHKRDSDYLENTGKDTHGKTWPVAKRMRCTAPVKISASHREIMQKHYANYYIEPKEKTVEEMTDVNQYASYLGLNPKVPSTTPKGIKRRQPTIKFSDYISKRDTIKWQLSSEVSKRCLKKIPGCLISEEDIQKSIVKYESDCFEEIKGKKKSKSRAPSKKKKQEKKGSSSHK